MEFFRANSALIGMIAALGVASVLNASSRTGWSQDRQDGYYNGLMSGVVIALGLIAIDGLKRLF